MRTETQISTHDCDPSTNGYTIPESQTATNLHVALLDRSESLPSAPSTISAPTIIDATKPPSAPPARRSLRRNGRVARLPKLQRDMVNRMIANGVHYKNIVGALSESGFTVTERNISNWAKGGHLEWRMEQELVVENRLDQDHLLDFLRREDAQELSEVGLQAAATRLSQILLQKAARGDDLEANLGSFSNMVEVLCRLTRELGALQQQRNASRRTLGPAHDPERIKDTEEFNVIETERHYSNPPAESKLSKPAVPPELPPTPTSALLEQQDKEAADFKELLHEQKFLATVQMLFGKKTPVSNQGSDKSSPPPSTPGPVTPERPAPCSTLPSPSSQ